jgi:hypothetical protein
MKNIFGGKLLAIAMGMILVLLIFSGAKAEDMSKGRILGKTPLVDKEFQMLSVSSAPGYCESQGGSHAYEYIMDAYYTRMTEDTISITVEIYIANPAGCVSGQPCPSYDGSPEYINAWIDWNGDQVFDSSERVLDVALTGYLGINYYGTMSTTTIVTVPEDAVDMTWMRVNLGWDHDPNDPCELNWTWGDIVDKVVSPRISVPIIDEIIVTGIPDAKNPMTSDTSVAGVEKVKLEAVITPADGYEVTNVSWSGDIQPGDGNPYECIADPGSHGMKYVVCAITYKDTSTNETWTDTKGRNFKLFFPKTGNDDGDSEPNWFEYWKRDGAVPNMNLFEYNATETYYGCYCGGHLYLTQYAGGQHYSSAIVLNNTHFGTESFGGPTVKGIDSAAEIIAHELYHKWVGEQWGDGWSGESDSDEDVCTGCDDNLPDDYETNTSHTSNSLTDTYDLEHKKHPDYKIYGDQEYMAMRTGNGARGTVIRDWANPGKQSDPPYGCHSLGDYAPVYAQFTGYYVDSGMDVDGDFLYDSLKVLAEVNVTAGGPFHIHASLMDQASNEVTWVNKEFILYPGTHMIPLDFDGLAIREHGVNGPYKVSILINDEEGLTVDHKHEVYTTAAYSYNKFEQRDARFSGTYSDHGTDSDGDGQYNNLIIEVDINVKTPKDYLIEGALYDSNGKAIQMASTSSYLAIGKQTVALNFSGLAIYRNRVDGPFYLKYLSISGSPQIDFVKDAYTTAAYNFTAFEKADANFSGVFSDHGTDTDSDGAYNFLTVDVQLNVMAAGKYTLTGWLYDSNGRIVMASNSVSLGTGLQTMQLDFDGASIYLHGADGLYYLKYLTLYNQNGSLMDTIKDAYTTGAYNHNAFQRPIVGLTGHYSDHGTDVDADGKFDYLTVEMEVLLTNPGYCVAKARLIDVNGKEIGWSEKIVNLSSDGPQTILLDFDGNTLYNHAVDGPYYLRDVYIYHAGDPFQPAYVNEAYTTAAYDYCVFGDCPPVADAGPDRTVQAGTDCMASVTLDGSGSFDPEGSPLTSYIWTWSLDGNPFSATGVTPTIQLPLGTHTITLVVSDGIMSSEPDTINITVVDSTSPNINVSVAPNTLWSPNHKMEPVTANVSVSDNCDPSPDIVLISVVSNEPDDAPGEGDGHTTNDIQNTDIGTEDYNISLRAERRGEGNGRTYTITYKTIDVSGNTATATATVKVPLKK